MTTLHASVDQSARERARLDAIVRYGVHDRALVGAFDRITALTARVLNVPIAIVTVVEDDQIWFKSAHGLTDVEVVDRAPGLCASVIERRAPIMLGDASTDPVASTHPFVYGEPGVRFYIGVPLTTRDGHQLGTLCALDVEPRTPRAEDLATVQDLAALVMDELELRLAARETVEREERLRREAEELADALQRSLLPARTPSLPEMEVATRYIAGERGLSVGGDFIDIFRLASNDWGIVVGDVCGRGARPASLAGLARWTIRGAAVHEFSPSDVLRHVNAVFTSDDLEVADDRYCSAVFARLQLDACGAWLTVANAGHPFPILVRRSGTVEFRTEPTLPVGLFDSIDPIDDRVALGPGDALVLYTDGITEARTPDGDVFGDHRLLEELRLWAGRPVEDIADGIIDAARRFAGRALDDDVAVVVIRVPDDASTDPLGRVSAGTGLPVDRLALPRYPSED